MNSKTRLGGDKEGYTVQQGSSGTYVSSELVGQLHRGRVATTVRQQQEQAARVEVPASLRGGRRRKAGRDRCHRTGTLMTGEKDTVVRRNFSGMKTLQRGQTPKAPRHGHQWRAGGTVVDRALTKFGTEETGGKPTTFRRPSTISIRKARQGRT